MEHVILFEQTKEVKALGRRETLSLQHRHMLVAESGITDEIIEARGYRTVTRKAELKDLGFSETQRQVPGLLIPIYNVHGEVSLYQARPDCPRIKGGKHIKYETLAGSHMVVDCHPTIRPRILDPSVPLWITEGIKKEDCLVSRGCCAVGLLGVYNWRGNNGLGGKTALPDWEAIALKQRTVYLVFDSDVVTKREVHQALLRLKLFLEQRGANVLIVYLPCGESGAKVGVDDFLVLEHSINDLVKLATSQLREPPNNKIKENTSFIETVNQIRLNKDLRAFEKKREIADLVIKDLRQRGKLIRTENDNIYYFEAHTKILETIEGEEFRSVLYERFGLNSTEAETRFVECQLVTHGMRKAERGNVYRLAHWSDRTKCLYVSANNGTLFKLDGRTIVTCDNGTDGALFLSDRRADPIEPLLSADPSYYQKVFEDISLAGNDTAKDHAMALLKIWGLAIFFLEAIPVRPILAPLGEQGSGKTTLGRRLGLVLYGRSFQVGSFRSDASGEQDFLAAISARRFLVFDNADEKIRWLPDHLAKLATGAEIERRKLYTTNELATFRPDCFLVITSREPKWKRDDVVRRLLPIRLETIMGAKVPEAKLQREIIETRPLIWGALLNLLNAVTAKIQSNSLDFTSSHRLADFHWFGSLAAPVLGIEESFNKAMDSLNNEQLGLLGEADDRLELLASWLNGKLASSIEQCVEGALLFKQLQEAHSGPQSTFPFKSVGSLGTWLGRHKDLINVHLNVLVTSDRTTGTRYWHFLRIRRHDGIDPNPSDYRNDFLDDIMTPQCRETVDEEEIDAR